MAGAVLLTGASSFTGMWIAEALAAAGFQVIAPLRRPRADYAWLEESRIVRLERAAEVVFACPFGSEPFLDLIRTRAGIRALAHHAADVAGYRDPGFDAVAAFERNMAGAAATLQLLAERGARALMVTGTVFEQGEGGPSESPLAVTPYGLSKTLTNIAFQHYADAAGLTYGKVVIPSPYGPYEQQRFPWYLFRSWFADETPQVRTPFYLRDHLPAPRLARAYADHLAALLADPGVAAVHRPSGWIASQGDFARKVAREAGARLGRECPVSSGQQGEFPEPRTRVNTDPCTDEGWDEARFWDDYVTWYAGLKAAGRLA
jgi:nucleoside-diphosphate-sugar epimerase